jgi:chlorophyllide a reductase subunit Z
MGYAGATYVIQELCNALFDALFHILPLGTDLDRVEATPARPSAEQTRRWEAEAQRLLADLVAAEPVLVQISAAKRLRDRAERDAQRAGEEVVTVARVAGAREALRQGEAA